MHYDTKKNCRYSAFTLIEFVVAIVILALFVTIAMPNFFEMLRKNTFKGQLQGFVSTMQKAATSGAESSSRYEVVVDLQRQSYMLREISSNNLEQVREDEIIIEGEFSEQCWVSYVLFDDGYRTNLEHQIAIFRVGHSGWQYGGKIVFLDDYDRSYTVLVNRLNGIIEVEEGDIVVMSPRAEGDVAF